MADSKDKTKSPARPTEVIKEGGYQPTTDPGPVPTSLIRPTNEKPAEKPQQSPDKK